jgi:DNA-binding GntR family transcriptional regulator
MGFTKEDIYNLLFNRILNGTYSMGTRLKEADLAEEFGLSRTPVREILLQLSQDGIVEINPNRGATVQPLTPDDIEELFELRKHLELLALEFSIHKINLADLQKIKTSIIAVINSNDYEGSMEADSNLHRYIVESSNKRRLISMVNQLLRIMQKFRFMGFHKLELMHRVNNEHIELIDALLQRDGDKAADILSRHLDNSKYSTLQLIFDENIYIYSKKD